MKFFGRKGGTAREDTAPRRRTAKGVPESCLAQPRRAGNHWANEWQHPAPDPGLPGICGYLNGIQGHGAHNKRHPTRFVYVRPDGHMDDERSWDSTPAVPSRRPVPRGFFGP